MDALGPLLGHSWPLLGRSWRTLGRSWAALGRSWTALGAPKMLSKLFFMKGPLSLQASEHLSLQVASAGAAKRKQLLGFSRKSQKITRIS